MTIQKQLPIEGYFAVLMSLLRDRVGFMAEIAKGDGIKHKITALMFSSSIFFAIYGAIVGSYSSWMQSISSAVKVPILYLMTAIVCFPTLYFFNVLFGSRKSLMQHLAVLTAAVASISILLFSFAPVTLFFLITAPDYSFFILLNVAIFGLTGIVGVYFLYQGMQMMSHQDDINGHKNRKSLLQAWLLLFAFVGSQLGWTLRPFFGAPGETFQLFRELEGNFYQSVLQAIGNLMGL
ncbi:MAG: actin-binding WH2 domain-containing protein [Cyanobacteria bacterium SID2]|nr:actin-binding WH2 domain-containing protein [Cyanobacteria bacterium SID2]MBP0003337.1 actin-binding WH2 domain-containing protein [Cyanobacteria bacterium SBC]